MGKATFKAFFSSHFSFNDAKPLVLTVGTLCLHYSEGKLGLFYSSYYFKLIKKNGYYFFISTTLGYLEVEQIFFQAS